MWKDKTSKKYLIGFFIAFVIFALIRNLAYASEVKHDHQYYFYMISQIGCLIITGCWMVTIRSRIINNEIRRLMLYTGAFFVMYFSFQMIKYTIFTENIMVVKYMWYAYYIPMTFIPIFIFYILKYLYFPGEVRGLGKYIYLLIAGGLISLGFFTNDIHELAFKIPDWEHNGDKGRKLGPVYYLYLAFVAFMIILALVNIIRQRKNVKGKKKLLYSLIPIALGIVYMVIYSVKPELIMFNGRKHFLEIAEAFAFMIIGFLEINIQTGVIPSNVGYTKLFMETDIPAAVEDRKGTNRYVTKGLNEKHINSKDFHIYDVPVSGGIFSYGIDLSLLNNLNKELDDTIKALESRNEILRHKNEITEEKEKSDAAIRIYDNITTAVKPQIEEIHRILEDVESDDVLRDKLIHCAVLNAFVKRRSNMELEAQKEGILPFKELVTAVSESLEYYKLSGTETFISYTGEGDCDSRIIITSYCIFEKILEKILGFVAFMTVRLSLEGEELILRFSFNMKNEELSFEEEFFDGLYYSYSRDGLDSELIVKIEKGGIR